MSLEEYEIAIKSEAKGFEIESERTKKQLLAKIANLKEVTSFKILQLESAYIETKLELIQERESNEMFKNDLDSQKANQYVSVSKT